MDIRPIKNHADYERALARVAEPMDAKPDSPDGDELEVRSSTYMNHSTSPSSPPILLTPFCSEWRKKGLIEKP